MSESLRRHIMMQQGGGGGHILPPGYTEYEWLVNDEGIYGNSATLTNVIKLSLFDEFDEIQFTFMSNDTSKQDVFFWGYAQGYGYPSLLGFADQSTFIGTLAFSNATINPVISNTEKGSGQEYNMSIKYAGNVSTNPFLYGAYVAPAYSKSRKIKNIRLLKNGIVFREFIVCTNELGHAGLWDGESFRTSSNDGGGFSCE